MRQAIPRAQAFPQPPNDRSAQLQQAIVAVAQTAVEPACAVLLPRSELALWRRVRGSPLVASSKPGFRQRPRALREERLQPTSAPVPELSCVPFQVASLCRAESALQVARQERPRPA